MYYAPDESNGLGQFSLPGFLNTVQNTGNTVTDVTQTVKSPQFQQSIERAETDAEVYMVTQLGLQTLATVATFGIFLIALSKFMKGK
jgi:hypothetical protein